MGNGREEKRGDVGAPRLSSVRLGMWDLKSRVSICEIEMPSNILWSSNFLQ